MPGPADLVGYGQLPGALPVPGRAPAWVGPACRRARSAGRGAHDKQDKNDKHHRSDHDEPEEQDDEQLYLDGDLLDLEPMLRDAIVLALPMSPLCRDDCPGLCVECGVPLADAGPDHRHAEATDPRWARLKQL